MGDILATGEKIFAGVAQNRATSGRRGPYGGNSILGAARWGGEMGGITLNTTEHYQLNQWDGSDRIMREDFNADNRKTEEALTELAEAMNQKADQAEMEARQLWVKLGEATSTAAGSTFSITVANPELDRCIFLYYSTAGHKAADFIINGTDMGECYSISVASTAAMGRLELHLGSSKGVRGVGDVSMKDSGGRDNWGRNFTFFDPNLALSGSATFGLKAMDGTLNQGTTFWAYGLKK